MPETTTLQTAMAPCAEAVRAYAAELGRRTTLRPTVREVDRAADVEFDAPAGVVLRVTWELRPSRQSTTDRADWEAQDENAGAGEAAHAIRHYARTMAALAGNPEAARALLEALGAA